MDVIQMAAVKQMLGRSMTLNYTQHCLVLIPYPLWLLRLKMILPFLNCLFTMHYFSRPTYILLFQALLSPSEISGHQTKVAKYYLRSHFLLIAYYMLRNKIHNGIRCLQNKPSLKASMNMCQSVTQILQMTKTHSSEESTLASTINF